MNLTTRARDRLSRMLHSESYAYLKQTLENCEYSGDYGYVIDLIEHGALLVDPRDERDNLLHRVLRMRHDSGGVIDRLTWESKIADIVEALLRKGVDLRAVNDAALHVVDKNEDVISSFKIIKHFEHYFKLRYIRQDQTRLTNIVDNQGLSLFHLLCKLFNRESLELFLKNVPNVCPNEPVPFDSKLYPGYAPIHFAVVFRSYPNTYALMDPSVQAGSSDSELDMSKVANVNAQDACGNTALHYSIAKLHNNYDFSGLLRLGADLHIENEEGWCVLDRLRTLERYNNREICEHLWKLKICNCSEFFDFLDNWTDALRDIRSCWIYFPFELFQATCRLEVEKMKNTAIVEHYVCLHDVMAKNVNKVASYTKLRRLREILEHPVFKKEFPLYGKLLRARFARGLARRSLLEDATDALGRLTRLDIPESCVYGITRYLSEKKLRDIIQAAG